MAIRTKLQNRQHHQGIEQPHQPKRKAGGILKRMLFVSGKPLQRKHEEDQQNAFPGPDKQEGHREQTWIEDATEIAPGISETRRAEKDPTDHDDNESA